MHFDGAEGCIEVNWRRSRLRGGGSNRGGKTRLNSRKLCAARPGHSLAYEIMVNHSL